MFSFTLPDSFIEPYKTRKVDWGFPDAAGNALGEITFLRTYSRKKEDGTKEEWWEVCRRVIEGMFSLQRDYIRDNRLPWSSRKAQTTARDAYERLFTFKWTPPGRGLWMMGTAQVNAKKNSAPLQNCAWVSTSSMTREDPAAPFVFLMEASMLGVGVGFDSKGAQKHFEVHVPVPSGHENVYQIPDTREGWVDSVRLLLESYLIEAQYEVDFDYSLIRKAGEPIRTFGGTAAGPEPLMRLHKALRGILGAPNRAETLTTTDIADIGNLIGVCVVSGNVRRSAEILLGSVDDDEFLSLKDYNSPVGRARAEWGWMSNNSVSVRVGEDLSRIAPGIARNGEPGVVWLDLLRSHGRLIDPVNNKDRKVSGVNPCLSYGTRLLTDRGLQQIGSLEDQKFKVWNGKRWTESKAWQTDYKKTVTVQMSNGQSIRVTSDHVLAAYDDQGEYEVKAGDSLAARVRPLMGDGTWPGVSPVIWDEALLLGLLAGDGFHGNGAASVYLKTREVEVIEFLVDRFGAVQGGTDSTLWRVPNQVEKSARHGFDYVPLPGRVLPEDVFSWSPHLVRNLLCGLYSANGSALAKYNRITLKSTSKTLVEQVQLLLSALGFPAYITTNKPSQIEWENGTYTSKESYDLNISGAHFYGRFQEEIGFLHEHKMQPCSGVDSGPRQPRGVTVTAVIENAAEPVYDFVEPETHWGWANGLKVHNCGEMSLESFECCTLVETYPGKHEDLEDYLKTIKVAYLYGKTVTLLPTHWEKTNAIMQRNRRVGTSMSGIANFADNRGLPVLQEWMDKGYQELQRLDNVYSEWLCVRESIKISAVKPSGTVSLITGESPGVHWSPGGKFFLRTVRFSATDPMVQLFRNSGYLVESAAEDPANTVVIYFPIKSDAKRSERDVSLFEKAHLAALAQRWWSDNAVSVTLSFDPETEEKGVADVLRAYEGALKTVSFLPMLTAGAYAQMPYSPLSEEQWTEFAGTLSPVDLGPVYRGRALDAAGEAYCTTDVCEVPQTG